ncbi:helix-turn-helix domain-containing protein [Saccharothrix violaceirubra]|uniref:Transcriptional regulator with XRE-family HTH domain n=1 Tax=Saccharothrix violaceirubra TaxID=413306 RepID=A0A7W7T109_9PSEU|nr:helix-turn-helix transcriptional regulator [Saccharothrix violaceirubra]MBB4964047.1 transcriptional regulator with XRE-family HTH domain [Saccharothrix violaceirubra]
MEDHKNVQRNLALQREWYGEPLGDRVRRLVVAFNVSQAQLADVLGISAPMLSQVMSGRRAKIGNPSVLARMIMLERKVLTPDVSTGAPEALQRALDEVRESKPTVSRDSLPLASADDEARVFDFLRRAADRHELGQAADVLGEDFPALSELLRRAGKGR